MKEYINLFVQHVIFKYGHIKIFIRKSKNKRFLILDKTQDEVHIQKCLLNYVIAIVSAALFYMYNIAEIALYIDYLWVHINFKK